MTQLCILDLAFVSPLGRERAVRMLACSFTGFPAAVREGLEDFIARKEGAEVLVSSAIYDQGARLRSYELLASAWADRDGSEAS